MISIGIINTNREPYPLPPGLINGGLWITGNLANTLSRDKNCKVIYFTAEDSNLNTDVKKITLGINSMYLQLGKRDADPSEITTSIFLEQQLLLEAVEKIKVHEFDILHVHNNFLIAAGLLPFFEGPILYTLHDPISSAHEIFFKRHAHKNIYVVTVSNYQRMQAEKAGINVYNTVYNGIDIENFGFNNKGGDNLLFSGRMTIKKGIEEAIKVAKKIQKKLIFAGNIRMYDNNPAQKSALNEIDNNLISWVRLDFRKDLIPYYGRSKATIAPILWEEPFGLIAIESMACGTPVIGYARGAFPESVIDGKTGLLVNPSENDMRGSFITKKTGFDGLCEAVERLYGLSENEYQNMRKNCREHVERNFTLEKMANEYKKIYNQIIV